MAIEVGHYAPDQSLKPGVRFAAGAEPANAVRVTFSKPAQTYFAKAFNSSPISLRVSAIASSGQLAMFSLGSRLVALRAGIVNQLLGALLGGGVSLSAVDYEALASADIGVFPLMQSLATQIGAQGTYGAMSTSTIRVGQLLQAMETVANGNGQTLAVLALRSLRYQVSASASLPLARAIDMGPLGALGIGSQPTGYAASLKAMDLISATALAANRGQQLSLNVANIPGVTAANFDIAVGQPLQTSQWAAVGEPGSQISTAQVRLRLTVTVAGRGVLSGAGISVPITLDIAQARARLIEASCTAQQGGTVSIAATPGIVQLAIGSTPRDMTDFLRGLSNTAATLVTTPLIQVRGSALVGVGNLSETTLGFTSGEIGNGTIKRTDTSDAMQSLFTSLLRNLSLSVNILGITLATPASVSDAVVSSLSPVAAALDETLYAILTALGLHVGEADVSVQGVRCAGAGQLSG